MAPSQPIEDRGAAPRAVPQRPIRAQLLAASALILVASTLLYGWVAFTTAREALLPSIREQLADDAANVKGGIEELLVAHVRMVRHWASLPVMQDPSSDALPAFLRSVTRDFGVHLAVLVLDAAGRCVASSDPRDAGRDFSGSSLLPTNGIDETTMPSLEWSDARSTWFIRLAARIPSAGAAAAGGAAAGGTLVAMLDREVLDRIVVSKPGHSHVELRMLDRQGRSVAGAEEALEFERVEAWKVGEGHNPDHYPDVGPVVLLDSITKAGRRYLVAKVAVGGSGALATPGWTLMASVPRDIAMAPVAAVRDGTVRTGIAVVLVGLLGTWFLAGRIARPIRELTAVAGRIARSGQLADVPRIGSRDEVGELAEAFQRMVDAVRGANDELVRTSKLAFLGEMAAGMAHELRTPLGIIRNSAQLLERRLGAGGDADAVKWTVFVREECDRLAKVVNELLDFVRPTPPTKADTDLDALARRTADMLAGEASNRGIQLVVEGEPHPVVAPCDADQFLQVLLNLAMNAMQASPRDGRVAIAASIEPDAAVLVVRDRGRGLAPAVQRKLFEPFTSDRDGGIGLGLAIVKRIVHAHGGQVTARNRQGGGARFMVRLPLAEPPAPGLAPPEAPNDQASPEGTTHEA